MVVEWIRLRTQWDVVDRDDLPTLIHKDEVVAINIEERSPSGHVKIEVVLRNGYKANGWVLKALVLDDE